MTDALKTALSGALSDSGLAVTPSNLNLITTALARRGVVVRGDGQREARVDLVTHRRAWLDAFKMARGAMIRNAECDGSYMDHETAVLERVVSALGLSPESPRSDVEAVAPVRDGMTEREEFWSRFTAAIDYKLGEVTPGVTEYRKGFAGGLRSIARWMGYTPPETVPEIPLDGSANVAILKDEIERLKLGWKTEELRAEKAEALVKKFTGALELRLQTYDELHAENDLSPEGEHGFLAFQVFARDLGFTVHPAIPAQPLRVTIGVDQ